MGVTVLGIDLSLTSTGLALVENARVEWTGTVKTTGKRGDDLTARTMRLRDIRNRIEASVMRYEPVLAVVEAPSFGSQHGSAHDRSGLWWAIVDMLYLRSVPVAQVTPKQRAKYATGNGNSQKPEVHKITQLQYAREDLPIKTNDEADAVLLAAMGSRHLDSPVEVVTPAQIAAMEKVQWPSL